jgi:hypothetical protein
MLNFFGGGVCSSKLSCNIFNNSVSDSDIKDEEFIQWIREQTHKYFNFTDHEEGGIITFDFDNIVNPYTLTLTNEYDEDGMILYPENMLNNIKPNQIIWHTHNIERGFEHEPPSAPDILILMDILIKNSKLPFSIAIHNLGIWIYKINKDFNQKQKENYNNFKEFVSWTLTTIDDIFSNSDPNTINKYDPDDLAEYNITKMETIQDYKNIINKIFHEQIYIDFIPFDTPI